jgi:hypothetical protein
MQTLPMLRGRAAWVVSGAVAVLLAAIGVWLYALDPSVGVWQLNGLLLLPLVAVILIGLHRIVPVRVQWIAAWMLAPLGGVAYVLWPNDQTWNYGMFTAFPLMALVGARAAKRGEDEMPDSSYGGIQDGPWGPP